MDTSCIAIHFQCLRYRNRAEKPERALDQMRADDARKKVVKALDEPLEESSVRRQARCRIWRAATRVNTMRAGEMATIHVTTIELVIGKSSGRAISRARCDSL